MTEPEQANMPRGAVCGYDSSTGRWHYIETDSDGLLRSRMVEEEDSASAVVLQRIESLTETIQEMSQRLVPLAGAIQISGNYALRVVGITMPSTAVTGPITNTQYVATPALGGVHYTQRTAIENTAAVLSNINNCTGA